MAASKRSKATGKHRRNGKAAKPLRGSDQKAAEKAARAALGTESLYTLEDLGQGLEKNPTEFSSVMESVVAVARNVQERFNGALKVLPFGHPADIFITNAIGAMHSLEMVIEMIDPIEPRFAIARQEKRTLGAMIVSYAAEAGRWIERAEIALGDTPSHGYLNNALGIVGGAGMRITTDEELEVLKLHREGRLVLKSAALAEASHA